VQQLSRRDGRLPLPLLAVEEPDMIGMMFKHQLAGILDRDQALRGRYFQNEGLGAGGLATAGCAGYQDVLARVHGQPQELNMIPSLQKPQQRRINWIC